MPHIVANMYKTYSWLVEGRQNMSVNWMLKSTHIPVIIKHAAISALQNTRAYKAVYFTVT